MKRSTLRMWRKREVVGGIKECGCAWLLRMVVLLDEVDRSS